MLETLSEMAYILKLVLEKLNTICEALTENQK